MSFNGTGSTRRPYYRPKLEARTVERAQPSRQHAQPQTWPVFVAELRGKLTPEERTFLDRALTKLPNDARERIIGLGIDGAIVELRREMGGRTTPLTTRKD